MEHTIDFAVSLPLTCAHFNPLAVTRGRPYLLRSTQNLHPKRLSLCLDSRVAASIELEYQTPEGSDAVVETSKCVQFCKNALA